MHNGICYFKSEDIDERFFGLHSVIDVDLNHEYNGIVKQFGGNILYNLENTGTFY